MAQPERPNPFGHRASMVVRLPDDQLTQLADLVAARLATRLGIDTAPAPIAAAPIAAAPIAAAVTPAGQRATAATQPVPIRTPTVNDLVTRMAELVSANTGRTVEPTPTWVANCAKVLGGDARSRGPRDADRVATVLRWALTETAWWPAHLQTFPEPTVFRVLHAEWTTAQEAPHIIGQIDHLVAVAAELIGRNIAADVQPTHTWRSKCRLLLTGNAQRNPDVVERVLRWTLTHGRAWWRGNIQSFPEQKHFNAMLVEWENRASTNRPAAGVGPAAAVAAGSTTTGGVKTFDPNPASP